MIAKRSARAPSHGSGSSNPKSARRLDYVGAAEHKRFPLRTARQQYAQRHSDEDGEHHRYAHQPKVFYGQGCHFAFMGEQKVQTILRAFDR